MRSALRNAIYYREVVGQDMFPTIFLTLVKSQILVAVRLRMMTKESLKH
jgi:hypothetical protein